MSGQLRVIVPVRNDIVRNEYVDAIAQERADAVSTTPVDDLRFVERNPAPYALDIDELVYEGTGTREEGTE